MSVGRRKSSSLTLQQIGERAGVSRSTVSRVLNQSPGVRPDVRVRVEQVIAETGYRPNQAARALVSRRSGLIWLIMLTDVDELFGDPYYSALVSGIQQGCNEAGLMFAVFPHDPHTDNEALAAQVAHGIVDGVIITAGPRSETLIGTLRDRGTPMVVVGHPEDDDHITRVDVANFDGAETATRHLGALGHNRIGFIGATPDHRYGRSRLDGYRAAVAALGGTVEDRLIRLDEPNADGGRRAAEALLDEEPDAIFVSTDSMAVGAYQALATAGVRIPDDVSIIGFDGFERSPALDPVLTTIVQPVEDVGRTAVALLDDDPDVPSVIVLDTTLRAGDSCAPRRGTARPLQGPPT